MSRPFAAILKGVGQALLWVVTTGIGLFAAIPSWLPLIKKERLPLLLWWVVPALWTAFAIFAVIALCATLPFIRRLPMRMWLQWAWWAYAPNAPRMPAAASVALAGRILRSCTHPFSTKQCRDGAAVSYYEPAPDTREFDQVDVWVLIPSQNAENAVRAGVQLAGETSEDYDLCEWLWVYIAQSGVVEVYAGGGIPTVIKQLPQNNGWHHIHLSRDDSTCTVVVDDIPILEDYPLLVHNAPFGQIWTKQAALHLYVSGQAPTPKAFFAVPATLHERK